jgi:uncharacterized protein YggE
MESKIPSFPPLQRKRRLSIPLDSRTVIIILLLVIAGMLFAWKPWVQPPQNNGRTVQVNGQATVKSEPDQFVFSPSYDFKNTDKQAALDALSKKSDEIVGQLKKLGLGDNQIKTNADGYERGIYFPTSEPGQTTYTLSINATVYQKELAQKVQDYLVSTHPSGAVTPYASFSKAKQKQLETQARQEAEKDARDKAVQSAKNVGFKLGAVKSVSESNGFGVIEPLIEKGANSSDIDQPTAGSGISVQPGQNELNYQISVTYYIK